MENKAEPITVRIVYDHIGIVEEIEDGAWFAVHCNCSGYVDEDGSAVITDPCKKHKRIGRIEWRKEPQEDIGKWEEILFDKLDEMELSLKDFYYNKSE